MHVHFGGSLNTIPIFPKKTGHYARISCPLVKSSSFSHCTFDYLKMNASIGVPPHTPPHIDASIDIRG